MDSQSINKINSELKFRTSRSSGPGGQNVNKVNTRVELIFDVDSSEYLSKEEKLILHNQLKNRINSRGELVLPSQSERSQLKNKEKTILRFNKLIEKSLAPKMERLKTRPTLASRFKRLQNKRLLSEKKVNRRKPDL